MQSPRKVTGVGGGRSHLVKLRESVVDESPRKVTGVCGGRSHLVKLPHIPVEIHVLALRILLSCNETRRRNMYLFLESNKHRFLLL